MKQTSKGDMLHRHRVLIDVDAERPDEHAAAITLISELADELRRRGWRDPLRGDSCNGGHLLYSIDQLPADIGLLKRVLEAFASRSRR